MRTIKLLSVLLACVAALSLTSCNGDDNSYTPLSKDDKAKCYNAVRGDYKGKLVYATGETKNGKTVTDTLDMAWSIPTDSTLVIRSFPSRLLAVSVTNNEVKQALSEAAAQDLTCRIGFVQTDPVAFLANPVTPSFELTYGGKSHKVQTPFYTNLTQSSGIYTAKTNTLTLQIIEGGLYIDGKQSSDMPKGMVFYLFGTKQ